MYAFGLSCRHHEEAHGKILYCLVSAFHQKLLLRFIIKLAWHLQLNTNNEHVMCTMFIPSFFLSIVKLYTAVAVREVIMINTCKIRIACNLIILQMLQQLSTTRVVGLNLNTHWARSPGVFCNILLYSYWLSMIKIQMNILCTQSSYLELFSLHNVLKSYLLYRKLVMEKLKQEMLGCHTK